MDENMLDELIEETGAVFSDVSANYNNTKWVRTPAKKVDIQEDGSDVELLAKIMSKFRAGLGWRAVSSNNIYWNRTHKPLCVIQIPDPEYHTLYVNELNPDKYLTVLNPTILDASGDFFLRSGESCGSLGEFFFPVRRHQNIIFRGYVLELGETRILSSENPMIISDIEHEIDHLKGILVSDYGPVFYLSNNNNQDSHDDHLQLISDSFSYVWSSENNSGKSMLLYSHNLNHHILLDNIGIPIPMLTFVLSHDVNNSLYWSVYQNQTWDVVLKKDKQEYGHSIIFEFPDTPEFRQILTKLPEIQSDYNFFNLPIFYAD